MAFEKIIGQKRVQEMLLATVERDRLPHALLFHGPEGVGKNAVAVELAKYLNCSASACRTCPSCNKISRGQHPDVRMIFPVPSSLKPEEIGSLLQKRAGQPYAGISFTKPASISIETVRALQKVLAYRPFEGKRKVVIIAEADKTTPEAANALLKTLEEPPPATLLILTTAKPHALLPTVASRCHRVRFDPLTDREIEHALIDQSREPPQKARLVSRLAVGNYRKAMEFIVEDVQQLRDEATAVLTTGLAGSVAKMVEQTEGVLDRYRGDDLKALLTLLLLWVRDLLLLCERTDEEGISNIDRLAQLRDVAAEYRPTDVRAWIETVKTAMDLIDRNVNHYLTLMGLMLQLKEGEGPPRGTRTE